MMRNIARTLTAACAIATLPALSLADEAKAEEKPDFSLHGYVSAGYLHNSGLGNYRTFDVQHDSFDLHQASLTAAYQPAEGFGGVVQLIAGEDAKLLNLYTNGGTSGSFDITQAFVQYATGKLTLMGGRFTTLVGSEVINPTLNTNTSRSLLFNFEPLTHTGVRATYAATDAFSFMVGVNNGWDQIDDLNSSKTVEVGMAWVASKAFTLTAQGYYGTEPAYTGSKEGARTILDLVGTWTVSDSTSIVFSYDYGSQAGSLLPSAKTGTANWQGIAGYVNYAIDDKWRVSVRAEYFDDADGVRTGTAQSLTEETLTLAYAPTKSFEIRAEVRADQSDKASFLKPKAAAGSGQTSYSLEGIFKF